MLCLQCLSFTFNAVYIMALVACCACTPLLQEALRPGEQQQHYEGQPDAGLQLFRLEQRQTSLGRAAYLHPQLPRLLYSHQAAGRLLLQLVAYAGWISVQALGRTGGCVTRPLASAKCNTTSRPDDRARAANPSAPDREPSCMPDQASYDQAYDA